MKIIALEIEKSVSTAEAFQKHAQAEAIKVWELQQNDFIREIYFRADQNSAVLVLESESVNSAKEQLKALPYVKNGLIEFELIPLKAYPGFSRLFK